MLLLFENDDEMSYVFEQAGKQTGVYEAGEWIATFPLKDQQAFRKANRIFLETHNRQANRQAFRREK